MIHLNHISILQNYKFIYGTYLVTAVLKKYGKIHCKRPVQESLFLRRRPKTLLKGKLWHRCFSVNFPIFL